MNDHRPRRPAPPLPPGITLDMVKAWKRMMKGEPIRFEANPLMCFKLVSVIQFALRSEAIEDDMRRDVEAFARSMQAALAHDNAEAGRMLEQGWHREYDVPIEGKQQGEQ